MGKLAHSSLVKWLLHCLDRCLKPVLLLAAAVYLLGLILIVPINIVSFVVCTSSCMAEQQSYAWVFSIYLIYSPDLSSYRQPGQLSWGCFCRFTCCRWAH